MELAQQEENQKINDLYSQMLVATNDSSQVTINMKQLLDLIHPVGSIYISTTQTNPSELFGGEWESYGEGRTLIGAGEGTDTNSTTKTFTANTTGGEYLHKLTIAEMPSHSHSIYSGYGDKDDPTVSTDAYRYQYWGGSERGWHKGSLGTGAEGGSESHNNIQPYIVTYMWKRIS